MKATILCIGDELLIGQTLNTNTQWISQKMNEIGVDVIHHITLSDEASDISTELTNALKVSQLVLITGGLGPTSDDITKDVLAAYFGSKLVLNETAYENIKRIFLSRNREMNDTTKLVAYLPDNCIPIQNSLGTAAGMLFRKDEKIIISMPGVPYEMKAMIEDDVIPYLKKEFELPVILHRTILTAGVGETQLADKLVNFENQKDNRIKLAYLPNVGIVRLRLTVKGTNISELTTIIEKAKEDVVHAVSEHVFGFENDLLQEKIGQLLISKKLQLGIAESCTGGYIGHLITSVPGSSAYFKGSLVTYANEAKQQILGVSEHTLNKFGAVSEQTVSEMLSGVLDKLNVDIAVAVSGIAGPDGGTEDKPVGTVFIGVSNKSKQIIKRVSLTNNRERNIKLTGIIAIVLLRKFLLNETLD